jgi:hypothetical protein
LIVLRDKSTYSKRTCRFPAFGGVTVQAMWPETASLARFALPTRKIATQAVAFGFYVDAAFQFESSQLVV